MSNFSQESHTEAEEKAFYIAVGYDAPSFKASRIGRSSDSAKRAATEKARANDLIVVNGDERTVYNTPELARAAELKITGRKRRR